MKKNLMIFMGLFISFVISAQVETTIFADDENSVKSFPEQSKSQSGLWGYSGKPGVWDYPVIPGMEEWKKLRTNEEMLNATQIPEEVLKSLSTEDLIDLCLRYPLNVTLLVYSNTNFGFETMFREFNGLRELYQRKDVSNSLIAQYMDKLQSFSLLHDPAPDFPKAPFKSAVSLLEVFLSRIEWDEKEGKESLNAVLQSLVAGFEAKANCADEFKGSGFRTNFYARANVISKMDSSFVDHLFRKEKNSAFSSGWITDEETVGLINEWSYRLIK